MVQKLILTHFYPECDKVDIEMQCGRAYTAPKHAKGFGESDEILSG